jgi:hypothetical protein
MLFTYLLRLARRIIQRGSLKGKDEQSVYRFSDAENLHLYLRPRDHHATTS